MDKPIVRLGDATSHGGAVTEGSANFVVDGQPVARLGDKASCPLHGDTVISSGSETYTTDGKPTARHGDTLACGATLIASQSHYFIA